MEDAARREGARHPLDSRHAAASHVHRPPRELRLRARQLDQRAVDVAMLDSHDLSRPRAGIRHEHDERSHRPHDDDIGSYEPVCMECHGRIHGGTHQGRI
ncbi:MAG TPA: hypothetical protein VGJ11_10485 [Gaiellales bacterium]